MVDTGLTVAVARLKREDCKRTKHDSHFSNWKILVGPSDWEDYSLGKEGAERYRVHNLPTKESPGVYELGIAVSRSGLSRETSKLDPEHIVAVYLGQADNVRTRLQQYGRSGAHLGNGCSTGNPGDCVQKRPGFFVEILLGGYPIVYRWAPMENKSAALKTETQLLTKFDYAWNTSINGARRPDDVLQKIKKFSSSTARFANISQKLLPSSHKKVGVRIESSRLLSREDKFGAYADRESHSTLFQIFKFGRSQPRLVLDRSGSIPQENTIICGVAGGNGSICRRPPVPGRKRCAEHKGMKIQRSTTAEISNSIVESVDSQSSIRQPRLVLDRSGSIPQENTIICGVAGGGGSICRRPPVPGRKRCAEHKGMKIQRSQSSVSSKTEIESYETTKNHVSESFTLICGFILANGCPCERHPIRGRKRCDEHKGRRIQSW